MRIPQIHQNRQDRVAGLRPHNSVKISPEKLTFEVPNHLTFHGLPGGWKGEVRLTTPPNSPA